MFPTRKRWFC